MVTRTQLQSGGLQQRETLRQQDIQQQISQQQAQQKYQQQLEEYNQQQAQIQLQQQQISQQQRAYQEAKEMQEAYDYGYKRGTEHKLILFDGKYSQQLAAGYAAGAANATAQKGQYLMGDFEGDYRNLKKEVTITDIPKERVEPPEMTTQNVPSKLEFLNRMNYVGRDVVGKNELLDIKDAIIDTPAKVPGYISKGIDYIENKNIPKTQLRVIGKNGTSSVQTITIPEFTARNDMGEVYFYPKAREFQTGLTTSEKLNVGLTGTSMGVGGLAKFAGGGIADLAKSNIEAGSYVLTGKIPEETRNVTIRVSNENPFVNQTRASPFIDKSVFFPTKDKYRDITITEPTWFGKVPKAIGKTVEVATTFLPYAIPGGNQLYLASVFGGMVTNTKGIFVKDNIMYRTEPSKVEQYLGGALLLGQTGYGLYKLGSAKRIEWVKKPEVLKGTNYIEEKRIIFSGKKRTPIVAGKYRGYTYTTSGTLQESTRWGRLVGNKPKIIRTPIIVEQYLTPKTIPRTKFPKNIADWKEAFRTVKSGKQYRKFPVVSQRISYDPITGAIKRRGKVSVNILKGKDVLKPYKEQALASRLKAYDLMGGSKVAGRGIRKPRGLITEINTRASITDRGYKNRWPYKKSTTTQYLGTEKAIWKVEGEGLKKEITLGQTLFKKTGRQVTTWGETTIFKTPVEPSFTVKFTPYQSKAERSLFDLAAKNLKQQLKQPKPPVSLNLIQEAEVVQIPKLKPSGKIISIPKTTSKSTGVFSTSVVGGTTKVISKEETKSTSKPLIDLGSDLGSENKEENATDFKSAGSEGTSFFSGQPQRQGDITIPSLIQIPQQETTTTTTIIPRTDLTQRGREPPKPPEEFKIPPPIFDERQPKKLINPKSPMAKRKQLKGFEVFVRRKGKEVKVSPFGLRRGEALYLGSSIAKKTAVASFKLKPAKTLSTLGLPQTSEKQLLSSAFRKPIRRGKPLNIPDVFIQKRKFRISSPGELKEITKKGWASRRTKWL